VANQSSLRIKIIISNNGYNETLCKMLIQNLSSSNFASKGENALESNPNKFVFRTGSMVSEGQAILSELSPHIKARDFHDRIDRYLIDPQRVSKLRRLNRDGRSSRTTVAIRDHRKESRRCRHHNSRILGIEYEISPSKENLSSRRNTGRSHCLVVWPRSICDSVNSVALKYWKDVLESCV
jgi:hypothetical protein